MSTLVEHWRARPENERRILAALAAASALALLVAFAWLPLERERARLRAALPALEASLALMQQQAEEVKRVRTLPAATPASAAPLASIVAGGSLTRSLPGAQAVLADERRVRLAAPDAPYGALLEAIAAAQSSSALRVESARIEALAAAGRVRAELTLVRP